MLREQITQLRARLLEIDGENAVAVFAADVWDELEDEEESEEELSDGSSSSSSGGVEQQQDEQDE